MTIFDRKVYFDSVRASLFSGTMSQRQVDGQEFILAAWEDWRADDDPRWLAYFLATAYHETSREMWPIEEYGKGEGHEYGVPDPETGQAYYGRGFVQLTWKENYRRADDEIGCNSVWHAEQQLDPSISARTGYAGMTEGWFRNDKFADYFNDTKDDPYGAREIINGDKATVPSWSNGISIGKLIEGYHDSFHDALEAASRAPAPEPEPDPGEPEIVVDITASDGVRVTVLVNGDPYRGV
jgi:hypothetical protein